MAVEGSLGAVAVAVPLALAALELLHPTWSDDSPSQAVGAIGVGWLVLHAALILGYGVLVWILWPPAALVARVLLALFALTNTAFLAVDGVGVGLLAPTQPQAGDALWTSLLTGTLAALAGATWSAALLALAATRIPPGHRRRAMPIALAATWFLFVISSVLPVVGFASLLAATAIAAFQVYQRGAAALPFALLVVAAMLHQHVGPEAAGGMLCIALSRARPHRDEI
jgi:hypothetical protein